jgi:hypothetical protein
MLYERLAIIGSVIFVGVASVFWFTSDPPVEVSKIKELSTSTSRTVSRVVDTRLPDGTHTIETTTQKDTAKVKEKHTEKAIMVPATVSKSQYRIGIDYLPSLTDAPKVTDTGIRGGARLGTSPVWVEVGIDLKHRQGSVGISVEW